MNTLRRRFSGILSGQGLGAKAMRGSALTILGFGGGQFLRLVSNLVLTRLLFPEAFGMMALVYVFMQGLNNFSDVGVTPSIMQSKRGDDPEFLNTAWTIQVIRGMLLWGVTFVIAYPAAQFFDAPMLAQLLPVVGVTLAIAGFNPTRLDTANRHLNFGRLTVIDLASQVVSLIVAIVAAWILQSVWALVISGIVGALVQLIFLSVFLPGQRNRFRWEPAAANELINFGKWIFLSTVVGFFLSQGDKIILGKYLSLETLGIYNIGFFWASFPMMLGGMVTQKILIPIYRETPPTESRENFLKLRKMRVAVSLLLMGFVGIFAVMGVWIVDLLYDHRYLDAGAIAVILAIAQMPMLIVMTYDQAALAAGDSKRFFVLAAARAVLMIACLLIGLEASGLLGALIGYGAAFVLAYPVVVWLARRMGAWDPLHDLGFAAVGLGLAAMALWINWAAILSFAGKSL